MIIMAIIVAIVAGFLGSWFLGVLGVYLNWPNAGAVFAAVTMGVYILYVMKKKDN